MTDKERVEIEMRSIMKAVSPYEEAEEPKEEAKKPAKKTKKASK